MSKLKENLWCVKYAPKTLEDMILPKRIKGKFIEYGLTKHYLLCGTAGVGKTTLARILAKGHATLFINASSERGIDIVRNKIQDFASLRSFGQSGKKVVILDEIDNLTIDAQKSLRGFIEEHQKNVLFIGTANYPDRIIPALKDSRFSVINFAFSGADLTEVATEYKRRCGTSSARK